MYSLNKSTEVSLGRDSLRGNPVMSVMKKRLKGDSPPTSFEKYEK